MSSVSRSVAAEDATWRGRANRSLESLLESYARPTRMERNGRIYELLGLCPIYRKVAATFGDPQLPTVSDLKTGKGADLNLASVKELYADSGYYEAVNFIYCIAYLPLLGYMYVQKQNAYVLYGLFWLIVHSLCVVLERYKRVLGAAWLEDHRRRHPDAVAVREDIPPISSFPVWMHQQYFRSYGFESEKLYRAVGTERFRLFVVWLKQLTTLNAEPGRPKQRIRYIEGITANYIDQFLEDTRISEVTHVVGTLSLIPFFVLFVREGSPVGMAALAPLIWGNVYSTLLQRYHRVRVARIRNRRRSRPA